MGTDDQRGLDPGDIVRAIPPLTEKQREVVRRRGIEERVPAGHVLIAAGDDRYDFVLIEAGEVEILRPGRPDADEEILARLTEGFFIGEWTMMSGQRSFLTARAKTDGRVVRLTPEELRLLLDQDAELADLILGTFQARRQFLRVNGGARSVEIIGSEFSAAAHALRVWAARQQIPHTWLDSEDPRGRALMRAVGAEADDLPAVVTLDRDAFQILEP